MTHNDNKHNKYNRMSKKTQWSAPSDKPEELVLEARFMPETVNTEAGTVDLVFATDTPQLRETWRGRYFETLSMEPQHVRLDRMRAGAPLLDNHDRYSKTTQAVLGVVESVKLEPGRAVCTVRFSKRENAQLVFADVADGILRNISVGFMVYTYEIEENADGPDQYRAIDWEPYEVSIVPVPQDYRAQVRDLDTKSKSEMKEPQEQAPTPVIETRQAETVAPVVVAVPDTQNTSAEVAAAERGRIRTIQQLARMANASDSVADDLIDRGLSVEQATRVLTEQWKANEPATQKPAQDARVGAAVEDVRALHMSEAIAHRALGTGELSEGARNYRALSLIGMARQYLIERNVNVATMGDQEIARRALELRSAPGMSTSDFPIILGNTINRTLRQAYAEAPRTFTGWARRVTAPDFKAITRAQLSGLVGGFDKIAEGGEYKYGTMTEARETYALAKYGKLIAVTWETLINDDLDAFGRIPTAMANEAAQLQSDLVYGILTGNPTMGDSVALFHSTHANLASSGAAITITTLGAARAAMRKQKGLNDRYLNLEPRFLIVGPDREVEAQQILSSALVPNTQATVNPFINSLTLVVDPRLGSAWFLSAAPSTVDTVEYAFLEGDGELFTETKTGFEIDGTQVKARMVFATAPIDFRGLYKNPGA